MELLSGTDLQTGATNGRGFMGGNRDIHPIATHSPGALHTTIV
jgi:hypothetical protein